MLSALAAGLALPGFALLPATAQSSAGLASPWHAAYQYKPGGYASYQSVAVSGVHAWAVGSGDSLAGDGLPAAAYLSDGRWRTVRVPDPALAGVISAVSADSPSDAWAVGNYVALHWEHGKWSVAKRWRFGDGGPPGPLMTGVTAVSPTNVWVFSDGDLGTWHFTGHRWTKVTTGAGRAIFAASEVSRADMWAIGGVKNNTVVHYSGGHWHAISGVPAGLQFGSITATSATSVWLTASPAGKTGLSLVHLHGHTWTSYQVPWALPLQSALLDHVPSWGISTDGHGGFWLSAYSTKPGARWLLHFGASRQWSKIALGGEEVTDIARIPGTTRLLATGLVPRTKAVGSHTSAVIWARGR
jgi:hypothetical protein